jgi:tRNA U34 5-carboxymethylaminomethyl modifying GTPase MnmE/TrmE
VAFLRDLRNLARLKKVRLARAEAALKKGETTKGAVRAKKLRLESAEAAMERVRLEQSLYEKYTLSRMRKELEAKVEEARRAVERVKVQAQAKHATADAEVKAKSAILRQEQDGLKALEELLKAGRGKAPRPA